MVLQASVSPNPTNPEDDGPLFSPRSTTVFRVALVLVVILVISTAYATLQYYRSPYWTGVGYRSRQPVLFSHRHHAGELHIDCRYCHATAETGAFAGMPSTHTCLTCHSQLFTDTPMLKPVIASAATDQPLRWTRVNVLPDHVYFDHSIHVAKGVGCTTCHGEVGSMPLTSAGERLTMRWCLDCHRNPAPNLRPEAEIFAPTWAPPRDAAERGQALMAQYHVRTEHLTNCSTCHH